MNAAVTKTNKKPRKLTSLGSYRTEEFSRRPSGWAAAGRSGTAGGGAGGAGRSTMAKRLLKGLFLLVQVPQANRLVPARVAAGHQRPAAEFPQEIGQPQPADCQRREEVHPV